MARAIDINRKYRNTAIYCAHHCGKDDGKARVMKSELKEHFGICYESFIHELSVKGMLFRSNDYVYLRPEWQEMAPRERMDKVLEWYPYPWRK
ncbi:MAG: hypothetical protein K6F94_07320 [Bacteroidaceae bacterium]|nr:hypothetical protein [Bacteroidaceae bacterium]